MAEPSRKSEHAFRTIGELAGELGVPQHILRYWETRFPQLRPLQRAGNRRYYRPADVALVLRIHRLLHDEGLTIRGVQQRLAGSVSEEASPADRSHHGGLDELRAIRDMLTAALEEPGSPRAPCV